jgi:hypothetical protein
LLQQTELHSDWAIPSAGAVLTVILLVNASQHGPPGGIAFPFADPRDMLRALHILRC